LDQLEFSRHGTQKMRDRAVKRQDIIAAVDSPDSEYDDVESDARVAVKQIDQKYLVVVYAIEEKRNRVITVYHASKVDRLIRRKVQRGAWVPIK
jgi:Domain of unknown function (DUF4258)